MYGLIRMSVSCTTLATCPCTDSPLKAEAKASSRGSSNTPIMETTPRPMRISESIKKGSKAGNTISHHILSPLKAEAKASSG